MDGALLAVVEKAARLSIPKAKLSWQSDTQRIRAMKRSSELGGPHAAEDESLNLAGRVKSLEFIHQTEVRVVVGHS